MTLRFGAFVGTLLVFSALLKNTQAQTSSTCASSTFPTTTTNVRIEPGSECNFTVGNNTSANNLITDLTPGAVYVVSVPCLNCSQNVTTKPERVTLLTVTSSTTSSITLTWTEAVGNSSFYRVRWTDGEKSDSVNVNETFVNITNLTAGVQYTINVTAVADDNVTEGASATESHYTKPEVVRDLNVSNITTSSVFVSWHKPEGLSSSYRVQWTDGNVTWNTTEIETFKHIPDLTAGVQYTINVTAVAADNITEGASDMVSQYTKPGVIQNPQVTTDNSSISLSWTAPPGHVFKYRVVLSNASSLYTEITNNTSVLLSGLTPGTSYNVSVTAIARDNKTEGEPFNVTEFTNPAVVIDLTVTDVTTSTVSLSWSKPEGNADLYTIRWTEGTEKISNSSNFSNSANENFTIKGLTPGFQYSISVAAVAYSKEGVKAFTSAFTTPVKPGDITAVRGTDSLNISWILPLGRADHYVVEINNTNLTYKNSTSARFTNAHFTDLYPGRIFDIKVTAVAGNLNSTSDPSAIATVPNPPGSIMFGRRTNSSLQLEWATPAMMAGAPAIRYYITYQSEDGEIQSKNSSDTNTELSSLLSGTSYDISVQTVGPQNLRSTFVNTSNFTLPNPVLNVAASPNSTSSVSVTWSDPVGVRLCYEYMVETYNATGVLVNTTVSTTNSTVICQLEPGSNYTVYVTTMAAPGSTSTAEQTSSYTMPKAVTNITVNYRNTTSIQLTWLRESDHKPSYYYLVTALLNNKEVHNDSTRNENYTFYHLVPGTHYEFTVVTVVEGVKSTEQKLSSQTIPEAASNVVVMGSTTSLTVSWEAVNGQVSSYSVLLNRSMQQVDNATDLSNMTLSNVFTDLKPGVLYCVEVVTKSGPLESSSSVCNATFPNPPGPITVDFQTVSSINFTWADPENMDQIQYSFSVSANESTPVEQQTTDNWFLLHSLSSGQPYSISVVTVGVLEYESTPVTAQNYTRPYPASNLSHTEVNTENVTLVWDQRESRPDYTYSVQVINGSQNIIRTKVVNETKVNFTGLLSGSNFSFTVTTRAADGTPASPETANFFTLPHMVRRLEAETLNTTAIKLRWMGPLEYKSYYKYRVTTAGCASQNITLPENTTVISELTPGTNCTLCVSVVAAHHIIGEEICSFQYTRPETAQPQISSQGSNSSVLVSWTHPIGNVEYYVVCLKHPNGTEEQRNQSNTDTSELFDNLSAGRLYEATITTFSGPFNASSSLVTNATYPNPPGPIEILNKTTNSIEFSWGEAPLMYRPSFFYQMTYTPPQGGTNVTNTTSDNTNHTFDSLDSGTSYNITVATVGVLGYQSETVYIYLVTTRPLSVESLMTQAEETNIYVSWSRPAVYKESYRYSVTWEISYMNIRNTTCTNCAEYNIKDLKPGSPHNISVTTETSDGTQAAPRMISNCTKASPVTILNVTCPDQEIAEITLNWTEPRGRFSKFEVIAETKNQKLIGNSLETRHTFSNLTHYTNYSLTVVTQSCGNPSVPVTTSCQTGITYPLIPEVFEKPVVTDKKHNQFTLQINSELLDNSRGPIIAVGVLVKRQTDVNSSLVQHLRNTYDEWKEGRTTVYLATVTTDFTPLSRSTQIYHFDIQIGTGSKWKGYTNGPLEPRGNYQAAIMVSTRLIYTDGLVDIGKSFVTITGFIDIGVLPPDPVIVPIAVGVTLGIFFILSIILIGFIIYWKRLSNKESSDIQIQSMRAKVSVAVTVEDFEAYYKKQKADSNCGFAEEFEDLKIVGTGQAKIHALDLENKPKNRYNNVLPYDSSRVKLSIVHGSPFDDYINANYMPGYNSRKEYIAAQGPLPTTVNDFWRMIWEKNVQTLVMLTRCNEQGRVKCEQYWSPGTKHFEDITVTTTSEIPLEDWTIRDFDIKYVKTAETRSVRHFHFTAWPDHGVPETTELLISFRHLVREHMNQYSRHSPTVVHCSAGVGRTGTFIAIDRLIFQIERENIVDVYGIVHDLRMHRPLMVQTEDQYVFLNQCALDVIRSRTGTNVDLIYQNAAALSIYENVEPKRGFHKNGYHNA